MQPAQDERAPNPKGMIITAAAAAQDRGTGNMSAPLRCSALLEEVRELRKLIRSEPGLHMLSPRGVGAACQLFTLGNCYLDYQGAAAKRKDLLGVSDRLHQPLPEQVTR